MSFSSSLPCNCAAAPLKKNKYRHLYGSRLLHSEMLTAAKCQRNKEDPSDICKIIQSQLERKDFMKSTSAAGPWWFLTATFYCSNKVGDFLQHMEVRTTLSLLWLCNGSILMQWKMKFAYTQPVWWMFDKMCSHQKLYNCRNILFYAIIY